MPKKRKKRRTFDELIADVRAMKVHRLRQCTRAEAQQRLALGTTLGFTQTVLLVTPDSVLWCSAARYFPMGDYHLVWTEHHGNFLEHDDEIVQLHVTRS